MLKETHHLRACGSILGIAVLLAVDPAGTRASVSGQSAVTRGERPATVALVDHLPKLEKEYIAVVRRYSGGPDVIILDRETADPDVLDAATRTLIHARRVFGDRPTQVRGRRFQTVTLGVRLTPRPRKWSARNSTAIKSAFDRLQSASSRHVPGLGRVQVVAFVPPSPPQRSPR